MTRFAGGDFFSHVLSKVKKGDIETVVKLASNYLGREVLTTPLASENGDTMMHILAKNRYSTVFEELVNNSETLLVLLAINDDNETIVDVAHDNVLYKILQIEDRSINKTKRNEDLLFLRGFAKERLSLFQEAITDLDKVITLDSEYVRAYFCRGVCKGSLNNYDEAIVDFSKVVELNPNHDIAYYNNGFCKEKLGRFEEAIDDYTKAIGLNQEHAASYFDRGCCRRKLGRFEEAIADFKKTLALDPKQALAHLYKGTCYKSLKNLPKAINNFNRVIKLDPTNASAHFCRGLCKLDLPDKNYDEIAADLGIGIKNGYKSSQLPKLEDAILSFEMKMLLALFDKGDFPDQIDKTGFTAAQGEEKLKIAARLENAARRIETAYNKAIEQEKFNGDRAKYEKCLDLIRDKLKTNPATGGGPNDWVNTVKQRAVERSSHPGK